MPFNFPGKSKPLVYAAWALIALIMATVVKYATEVNWPSSLALAAVTGLFGCVLSIVMCRFTDRQNVNRLSLIVFCGACLVLTLVLPRVKGTAFDPTAMKLFLFTAAGLVLTAFFLPESPVRTPPPKPAVKK